VRFQNNATRSVDVYCETKIVNFLIFVSDVFQIFSNVNPGEMTDYDFTCLPGGQVLKNLIVYPAGSTTTKLLSIGFGTDYGVFVRFTLTEDNQHKYGYDVSTETAQYACVFDNNTQSSFLFNNLMKINCVIPNLPGIPMGNMVTLTSVVQQLPNKEIMSTVGPNILPSFKMVAYWTTASTKSGSTTISEGSDVYINGEFSTNSKYKCVLERTQDNQKQVVMTDYSTSLSGESVACKIINVTGLSSGWFFLTTIIQTSETSEGAIVFAQENPNNWPQFYLQPAESASSTAINTSSSKGHYPATNILLILVIAIPVGVVSMCCFIVFVVVVKWRHRRSHYQPIQ